MLTAAGIEFDSPPTALLKLWFLELMGLILAAPSSCFTEEGIELEPEGVEVSALLEPPPPVTSERPGATPGGLPDGLEVCVYLLGIKFLH